MSVEAKLAADRLPSYLTRFVGRKQRSPSSRPWWSLAGWSTSAGWADSGKTGWRLS